MANLDPVENRTDADMAALYWWRRDTAKREDAEAMSLMQRIASLAERAVLNKPHTAELPGNRLRANAKARRARESQALTNELALDPALLAAIRCERRNALVALATGLVATAVPVAAAIYAAVMREPIALGFAIAGGIAASFALYHAARWFLLTRADAPPNIVA
jgi:hypothetical protein